ncbi:WD40-repeat-containing domain protein [Crucibulum laeve]|uniref:WD40-repeat-containing domain protein n=1 Tax=Crucibulum laeve TaxID=68775 RepID=A0A5C3LW48_9AGAR|nr:WD40-repeat-containing domain protein [Crucibulum laeve]
MRNTNVRIDYSMPTTNPEVNSRLLTCSQDNIVFFARGNRVHYKHLTTSEEVGHLCKLQETRGDLRVLTCAGETHPELIALGTSKGYIQIWDVKAKKMTMGWSTKEMSAMAWNGPVLSVGSIKGTIRHFDTRIEQTAKMKEQAPKVTRHQGPITSMGWNSEGKYLASGDKTGTVYTWEMGQRIPLDVGDFVQRRKKMQHTAAISVITWCPWIPKVFTSADVKGTIRLWSCSPKEAATNALAPGVLELDSPITGLYFSPHCKEFLTVHASAEPFPPGSEWKRAKVPTEHTITVHAYPSLRHIKTQTVVEKAIGDSVLNSNGTKLVFQVPEENKLYVSDVWAKRKEIRRQASYIGQIR